jgi:pyruvate/2-oxoglutarate dehydrogenase complex dihydrolipoamide dehydrogenase (E3) component
MSEIERYDVLVVGSGKSGKYMAWTMAKAGHRTAVIERKLIVACLPSKNIIRSASVASLAKRREEFGRIPESRDTSNHS